jgi:hypothetical protein
MSIEFWWRNVLESSKLEDQEGMDDYITLTAVKHHQLQVKTPNLLNKFEWKYYDNM